MSHRVPTVLLAVVAVATVVAVAGCGLFEAGRSAGAARPTPDVTAAPATTGSATTGLGDSAADVGDLPDPCTLLGDAEVRQLTGRDISQMDPDGTDGGGVRYCQWQQSGGQLDVFLARTNETDFDAATADGTPVDDVGDKAADLNGHLYVLYGSVQLDVYVRGDEDDTNLDKARQIADVVMGRL